MSAPPSGPLARIIQAITLSPARHPAIILTVVAGITLFLGAMVLRVRVDSSMETLFHAQDPERIGPLPGGMPYEEFKQVFGDDEIMVVAIKFHDGDAFTPAALAKVRRVTDALESLPTALGISRVISLTNVDDVRATEDGFEVFRLVGPKIPGDPVALATIRAQAFRNPLFVRNLVGDDGRAAAINIWLENRPGDKDFKAVLFDKVRAIVEPERGPDEVHYAGIPILTSYTSEYLRGDLMKFVPLTVLVIAITLFFTFRSAIGVALPLVTVGLACTWMLGLIGLLGRSISMVSSVVPSLVLACGSAEVIHVMGEYYRQDPNDPKRLEHMLHHLFAAVFIAGFTTVAGFGAMLVYDIPQVFEFGLYSAFGIFAEMLLALFFVPAVLAYLKPVPPVLPDEHAKGALLKALLALARFDMQRPLLVCFLGAVSLGIGIWGCTQIHVDTDYASYFKPGSVPVRALRFMRENLSGERPINVVVRAKAKDGTLAPEGAALEPEALKRVEALERRMRENPLVAATISVAGYLKNINRSMHDDDDRFRAIPETRTLAMQYLDLYGRPNELKRFVSHDRTAVNVVGRSSIISSEEFLAFMDELRAFCARTFPKEDYEVSVTGSMYLLSKASITLARDQALSFGWADLLVFAMMVILFRSLKIGFLSMIPNILPIIWCYGAMGIFGVALSTGTSVIAAMSLGIVVDDTVHILARYQHLRLQGASPQAAVTEVFVACGRPVIFTGITNFCGFMVLALSSFTPLISVGWLTGITMLTALSGDLVLQPALLVLFDRKGYRFRKRLTPDPDALDAKEAAEAAAHLRESDARPPEPVSGGRRPS